jgi:hypothetical protein
MKPFHLFIILFLSQSSCVHAEIYKRVDSDGHVTYSSEHIKGGKKLDLKPLPTTPGTRASRQPTPEDFPKVDSQTQKGRDATRRIILQDELATEEKLLATAQQDLKNIEKNPENIIGPDGTLNPINSAKHAEKLKAAQGMVVLHEQNIKALKTEISNLK